MQNNKFNAILVGLGQMGKVWLSILKSNPQVNVVALVDINTDAAKLAAKEFNLPDNLVYPTLTDALNANLNPHIVVDVTPPFIRAKIVVEALNKGLFVLSEKPMGMNAQDVKSIFDAAESNKSLYMISQNYRWSSGATKIKQILEQGVVGKIKEIYIHFSRNETFKDFRANLENPLLIDMAIHHFDLARYFTNSNCSQVLCKEFNPKESTFKQNAAAVAELTMQNNIKVTYSGNWADTENSTTMNGNWVIKGDDGLVLWDGAYKLNVISKDKVEQIILEKESSDKLAISLNYFIEAIKTKKQPSTSYKDNVNTINMVLGAVESSKLGKVVTL